LSLDARQGVWSEKFCIHQEEISGSNENDFD
jgi:hypothetical protein